MMWGDLPPAGNPIVLQHDARLPEFPGYLALWVNSGTAALALALIAARKLRPQITQPQVILPGYGCPDLIAAAEYAGVGVVLADIGRDDPGYDLAALKAALTPSTIAVVAVNFLGIRERLTELRELIGPDIALIEDNAQWFPEPASDLQGDLVCLSFGRGKPVSLLGGGALLVKQTLAERILPQLTVSEAINSSASYPLKVAAYNMLLNPIAYMLLSRNPLLKLGQTRYKELTIIHALDEQRKSLLSGNRLIYLTRTRTNELQLRDVIAGSLQLTDVAASAGQRSSRLLRYPILCADMQQRDRLWELLRQAGLGATAMYQRVLPEIPNVAARIAGAADLVGARAFAQRLLTLPVHSNVNEGHIKRINNIVAHL